MPLLAAEARVRAAHGFVPAHDFRSDIEKSWGLAQDEVGGVMATAVSVKDQAHALIDRMPTGQVSAVVTLLEAMLDPVSHALAHAPVEDELASDEKTPIAAASREWLRKIVSSNGESIPGWVRPTIAAFNEIGRLSDNWDTYGGKAANVEAVQQSFSLLRSVMQPNSPAPSVVPLSDGGVQLEWHRNKQDLEIVLPCKEDGLFLYSNRATGDDLEGSVREIEKLADLIGRLA
jgi:hypothetical protein